MPPTLLAPHLSHLPAPPPEAEAVGERLRHRIAAEIENSGGWISFARFMELALYAPALGYYSAGSAKLGAAGDFVTAPELTPLFGSSLARQVAQVVGQGIPNLIEVGAGSGALAARLLSALESTGNLPERYLILEVSADLRERQRTRIEAEAPHLLSRVEWLDALPAPIDALLIANELLDAVPASLVRAREGSIEEIGVTLADGRFERAARPATGALLAAAKALNLADDYETEINLAARALVRSFAAAITRGAMLFIDYGFPSAEYYHPQRSRGTLMCHYRHHAHDDPLTLVGLQDITAHVDFTSIADAALEAGLEVLGYTSQARFLVNCGITDLVAMTNAEDVRAYAPLASQTQKLLSPAEMGELFKVIAIGRGIDAPLSGFARGDRTHAL
jgi:SAM-dependent MidA family methyltransferase